MLDGAAAPTAEALMRSRYAAFCVGDFAHLHLSWHPATRPARLDAENDLAWERLDIDAVQGGSIDDTRGTVSFRAAWRDTATGERGVLAEVSRFRRVDGRWVYLDGAVDRRSV